MASSSRSKWSSIDPQLQAAPIARAELQHLLKVPQGLIRAVQIDKDIGAPFPQLGGIRLEL
jgi:hypothetical protein